MLSPRWRGSRIDAGRTDSGRRGDFSDFVHAYRSGIRDRLENGLDRRHFTRIMNLLLVPMWMVSGALFPMATAHGWVKAIMWVNPLTYSVALLNHTLRLPECLPRRDGEPGRDGRVRPGAAAGLRQHGGAKIHAERGMKLIPASAWLPTALSCCCTAAASSPSPFPILGRSPNSSSPPRDRPAVRQPARSTANLGRGFHLHHLRRPLSHDEPPDARHPGPDRRQLPDLKLRFLHRGSGARHAAGARRVRRPFHKPTRTAGIS